MDSDIRVICDATNYIVRYCKSHDDPDPKSCAHGLLRAAMAIQGKYNCEIAGFCFEGSGKTWREERWAGWKANREERSQDIPAVVKSIEHASTILTQAGMKMFVCDGFEADDVVASLTRMWLAVGDRVLIWSSDKDFFQLLLDGRVTQLRSMTRERGTNRWDMQFYTAQSLLDGYEVRPDQWAQFRTLVGDPSDGWPGADGIGVKTAAKLLQVWGSIDKIDLLRVGQNDGGLKDTIKSRKVKLTGRQQAGLLQLDWHLGLDLMTLRQDANYEMV